jgi:class 3 adenylate cyclase
VDERPETRYVKAPDGVSIAYQVTGDGPLDLVFPPGLAIPIDMLWENPSFVRFAKRLGGFSRTIWRELRGIGASGGHVQDLVDEDIICGDLTAVLDAVGCERVVLVGFSLGGSTVIRYATRCPERVMALVLMNTYAAYLQGDDYPWGLTPEGLEAFTALGREVWGTGTMAEMIAPSKANDEGFRRWLARAERLGAAPDTIGPHIHVDVRALLPALDVPTLVLHRTGNRFLDVGVGRYLGEHIAGARYVELAGDDHLFFVDDSDAILDEIEEFLTGGRQAPEGDVITTTILFTDIVSSTEQSARLGHRKWTALTDQHDAMVRATLERHRGREIKTIGDGFLATFDANTRAVRAAVEIVTAAKNMGLEVRAGVHTGEVEVRPDDVVGLPVNIAKRVCDLAGAGEVYVSEVVNLQLVGSGIATSEKGMHELKGVPGTWRLFAVGG